MRYGLVACGSNSDGRIVGLEDLLGPFQPCGCITVILPREHWMHVMNHNTFCEVNV